MPATLEEVQNVIREAFPDSDVAGVTKKGDRVYGTIIWAGFKNKNSDERNRLVTEKVRDRLGFRGINIGILFPLAPKEKF